MTERLISAFRLTVALGVVRGRERELRIRKCK
jgi:hypothetical protein